MTGNSPSLVVTGASGFIGRHFLDLTKSKYRIYAIARRSRAQADFPYHPNIRWIQCDIADWPSVQAVIDHIGHRGGADFVLHLAAYYDFTYRDSPEYHRTNEIGTKHALELAKALGVQRFVFASSLIASNFPAHGEMISESSAADADFPYARSKRIGEELVRGYSTVFPCSVVRLAAVFSDWCEYAPLYRFLCTWCSGRWDSRILGGRGQSAVPYIHVHDVVELFTKIISDTPDLPPFDVYAASPDGATSHSELFDTAMRYWVGRSRRALRLPKPVVGCGIAMRVLLHRLRLIAEEPFERLWMVQYIDRKLNVDSSYTRKALAWEPTPRYGVLRRLPFLMERMRVHAVEWRIRNELAMKRVAHRPNLLIYEQMLRTKDAVLARIGSYIEAAAAEGKLPHYGETGASELRGYLSMLFHLLLASVRSGDRTLVLEYVDDIAPRRFAAGFDVAEVCDVLSAFNDSITSELLSKDELQGLGLDVRGYIGMTIQLVQDEIEDVYERLEERVHEEEITPSARAADREKRDERIRELSERFEVPPGERIDQGENSAPVW